ncbi:ABC transporter ATP-binding protein [Mesorhizobium sp. SP-1A]|uniref:ABC transporter ATP-binding protein n=1 Tax=Mesorhizobium sp. SP-1A TaxID=3077840 RepID=UPI0028F6D8D8|nr:ABC transporter ATP-binding protein [Mesorhizobium sp. SP-1A]
MSMHGSFTSAQAPKASVAPVLLDLQGIDVRFGDVVALAGIDLQIKEGEFVAVVGPSGCGKSTLMHVIAGFTRPSAGKVLLNGKPITAPGADRTVVLQQATLFPWLSVRGNVELGPRSRGVPKGECERLVDHYLDLVGLSHAKDRKPYELSGGMQQRVSLARALANDTKILLVDEPFGALDALTRDRMQREIVRIWHETGKTVLFITHDVEEAAFCATSIAVMGASPGHIIERVDVPFSKMYATHELKARAIRSLPEYIELRENVLRKVLGPDADDD